MPGLFHTNLNLSKWINELLLLLLSLSLIKKKLRKSLGVGSILWEILMQSYELSRRILFYCSYDAVMNQFILMRTVFIPDVGVNFFITVHHFSAFVAPFFILKYWLPLNETFWSCLYHNLFWVEIEYYTIYTLEWKN